VTGPGDVGARIAGVVDRIAAAARAAGRDPAGVRLVAASKTRSVAEVLAAAQTGRVHAFGENRVQEALPKIAAADAAGTPLRWHFIGRLQRNKVKDLAPFELVHSVDSPELVDAMARRVPGTAVLVQVNMGFEVHKGGVAADDAAAIVRRCLERGIRVEGLMTMPPQGDEAAARSCFAGLRELRDTLAADIGVALPELSMGMSEDFECAIAEGATLVRVGREVFGAAAPGTALPGPPKTNM